MKKNEHSDIEGWSEMNKYTKMEVFIKCDNCDYLQGTKTLHQKKSNDMKNVFESCGTQLLFQERYKLNVVIDDEHLESVDEDVIDL